MANTINDLSEAYALWSLYVVSTAPPKTTSLSPDTSPWRPPQWDGLTNEAAQLALIKTNVSDGTNYYFFDAILHADHTTTLKATENPVQTGASITDHAYMLPARLTLSIAMSDAMTSMLKGQWQTSRSRSVSAYRTLVNLQQSRVPLTIMTRLNLYENMIIEQITAPDDYKTKYGLKCTINFRQIMVGMVATTTKISSAPQITDSTSVGTVQPIPLTEAQKAVLVSLGFTPTY